MALVTTPGAVDADTYASLAEAVAYVGTLTFAGKWPSGEPAQEALLKQAARKMDTLSFKGTRAASAEAQALAFPRAGLVDRDGYAIASNVVPRAVKTAQIELALWLAKKDRTADPSPSTLKVGSLEISGSSRQAFPDHVMAILAPFLNSYGCSVKLVRA